MKPTDLITLLDKHMDKLFQENKALQSRIKKLELKIVLLEKEHDDYIERNG